MDTERWRRIEVLFDQAMELPDAERGGFLDRECGGDAELRRELAGLVSSAPTAKASLRNAVVAEVQRIAGSAVSAQVGRRIGPFRLIGLLGEGGMGAVYLAERDDAQFAQRVAIKIAHAAELRAEAAARAEKQARQEADALNQKELERVRRQVEASKAITTKLP